MIAMADSQKCLLSHDQRVSMGEIAFIIRFIHFQAQSAKVAVSNRTAAGICRAN